MAEQTLAWPWGAERDWLQAEPELAPALEPVPELWLGLWPELVPELPELLALLAGLALEPVPEPWFGLLAGLGLGLQLQELWADGCVG